MFQFKFKGKKQTKTKQPMPQFEGRQAGGIPSYSREVQPFVLLMPSKDWLSPPPPPALGRAICLI